MIVIDSVDDHNFQCHVDSNSLRRLHAENFAGCKP